MVKSLSIDLRKRVVSAVARGMSRNQAAARFGVSVASALCCMGHALMENRPQIRKTNIQNIFRKHKHEK